MCLTIHYLHLNGLSSHELSELNHRKSIHRGFDKEVMRAYTEQETFNYMNYTVRPPSIWERISWWVQSLLQEVFLNPNTPWVRRIAFYVILFLVVGAAVFYIIKLRYGGGLTTDYRIYQPEISSVLQTKPDDFEILIQEAIKEQNFKLAIRYLYLKTLSSLSKKGKISLKEWKSPYDYRQELKGDLADSYTEIAQLFEYIWYGDFDAGQEEFQKGKKLSQKLESNT
ncbi:MAG: DUF4129 domain-containing protein [Bacteroidota bacterium]